MPSYGCTVVGESEYAAVDVVFIHGIRGDARRTWTSTQRSKAEKPQKLARRGFSKLKSLAGGSSSATADPATSVFWPGDFLLKDVPGLRVITFGYNADVSAFLNRTSDSSIFSIAQDLVVRLEMLRDKTGHGNSPIIFVAHSLGGLVIKDALKFSQDQEGFQTHLFSIFRHTFGVIFLGTPHRGSEMASMGRIAANIARLGLAESDNELLRALELGSTELQRISDAFSRMLPKQAKGLNVYSFLEGLPITGLSVAGKIVEEYSSIIGDAYEGKATINANHMEMCRFTDRDNSDYQLVSGVIRRWSRLATEQNVSKIPAESQVGSQSGTTHPAVGKDTTQLPISLLSDITLPVRLPQLPARHFCGRENELLAIKAAFDKQERRESLQRVVVIHGLGGVGKTQLGLSYALNNKGSYKAIFWINAISERTIRDHFRQISQFIVDWAAQIRSTTLNFSRIAFDLGLGQAVSATTGELSSQPEHSVLIVDAMKAWLERAENQGWLMVFDAADDLDGINLPSFFPNAPNGHILVTSRRPQATQLGEGIEVSCLRPGDGGHLLCSQAQLAQDASGECEAISAVLGHLPLAIAQAGAYIAAERITAEAYLSLYQTQRDILLRHKPVRSVWQYKETVFTTWELSFSAIALHHPHIARLLLFLGYLQPDDIWYDIFLLGIRKDGRRWGVWETFWKLPKRRRNKWLAGLKLSSRQGGQVEGSVFDRIEWLEDLTQNLDSLKSAISVLRDYSLVQENSARDGISMHSMVHEWCRHRNLETRSALFMDFVFLMGRVLDTEINQPASSSIVQRIKQHVPQLLQTLREISHDLFTEASKAASICHALESIGDYITSAYSGCEMEEAVYVYRLALESTTAVLSSENQLVLALMGNLSLALRDTKAFHEAVPLAEKRVALCTKLLGNWHADTLSALHDLGRILVAQGTDRKAAREVLTMALKGRIQVFGKTEPTTITMTVLAMLLSDCREFDEASELLEDAISCMQESDNWPLRLESLGCLAWVVSEQGRQWEAFNIIQKAAELATERYGPNSTAANDWYAQLAFHGAESLPLQDENTMKSIELAFDRISFDHGAIATPWTHPVAISRSMADFYYSCGQTSKAIQHLEEALEAVADIGTLSISVKRKKSERVVLLGRRGKFQWDCGLLYEAIQSYDESIAEYPDHEDTPTAILNKAVALRDLGQLTDAETFFTRKITDQSTDFADLDYTNLASIYRLQGRLTEAMTLYQRTAAAMENNPDCTAAHLLTLHSLAALHEEMGDSDEAIRIMTEAFNGKVDILGICRTATLKTAITLRRMLAQNGRAGEAAEIADRIRPFLEYA